MYGIFQLQKKVCRFFGFFFDFPWDSNKMKDGRADCLGNVIDASHSDHPTVVQEIDFDGDIHIYIWMDEWTDGLEGYGRYRSGKRTRVKPAEGFLFDLRFAGNFCGGYQTS